MDILMLLEDTYPTDIRVRKEAHTLLEAGHDVTLLCYAEEDAPATETVHGIDVRRVPLRGAHAGVRGLVRGAAYMATHVHRGWAATLERYMERDVDAVHVHDLPLVRTALSVADGRDVRIVADLHENWPEAVRQYRRTDGWRRYLREPTYLASTAALPVWRLKRLERDCVRRADHVVTVAEEAKTHYVEDCGAEPQEVTVVSNAVSLDQFRTDDVRQADVAGEFVVSYVGTLGGKHRGLETVVRAMAAVLREAPGAHLLVVGPGRAYRQTLEDCARELGIADRVTFTGWVDFEAVPRYIAASDICLVPHAATPHTETTVPHKLFQYMALGKPVVVTDVAPLKRVVEETECGIVVPAGDVTGMAEALLSVYDNPDTAAEMGDHGRRAVHDRYNWVTEGEKLAALYDSCICLMERPR